nr:proline-rich protein 1-like [Penaeus vannamei]
MLPGLSNDNESYATGLHAVGFSKVPGPLCYRTLYYWPSMGPAMLPNSMLTSMLPPPLYATALPAPPSMLPNSYVPTFYATAPPLCLPNSMLPDLNYRPLMPNSMLPTFYATALSYPMHQTFLCYRPPLYATELYRMAPLYATELYATRPSMLPPPLYATEILRPLLPPPLYAPDLNRPPPLCYELYAIPEPPLYATELYATRPSMLPPPSMLPTLSTNATPPPLYATSLMYPPPSMLPNSILPDLLCYRPPMLRTLCYQTFSMLRRPPPPPPDLLCLPPLCYRLYATARRTLCTGPLHDR